MGHLPRKERVGCGGGSEVAAEERGGRGESERSQEKGREARASARPAPPTHRPGLLTALPAPTVRTLEKEEPRGPSSPRRDLGGGGSCRAYPVVTGHHFFLQRVFR